MPEIIAQLAIGLGLFNRIKILTLDIFDQRDLERFFVGKIADYGFDLVELRALCCTPAPLTGDNLIAPAMRADEDGLNQAVPP